MKTLILGMKNGGKTEFIQDSLIPTLKEFTVIDLCGEYSKQISSRYAHFHSYRNLGEKEIKKAVINDLKTKKYTKNNTWILDSFSYVTGRNLSWLEELIKDKNVIMTFTAIQSLKLQKVPNVFDEIYFFPTMDNDRTKNKFLQEQLAKGVAVHLMNGRRN